MLLRYSQSRAAKAAQVLHGDRGASILQDFIALLSM
jgi:hypothetical protein